MELCRFNLESRCTKGAACSYSHEPDPQRGSWRTPAAQPLATRNKRPCRFYQQGSCRRGSQCAFDHEVAGNLAARAIRPTEEPALLDSRKRLPCKYYLKGSCTRGSQCQYSHAAVDGFDGVPAPVEDEHGYAEPDSLQRTIAGSFTRFTHGAAVSDVSLATDFSTVLIAGLPLGSDYSSVHAIAHHIDQRVSRDDIRFIPQSAEETKAVNITFADPNFDNTFISKLKETPQYAHLQAEKAPPRLPAWASLKRISSKKVMVSWYNPTKTAWLNYSSLQRAKQACNDLNGGRYKICHQVVNARQPTGRYSNLNPTPFTVVLQNVPLEAVKADIISSIKAPHGPQHIELSHTASSDDDQTRIARIESLLTRSGPNRFTRFSTLREKKSKAVAYFEDEEDARKAVDMLHDRPQSFLNESRIFLQLLSSSRLKVSTRIYGYVKLEIDACLDIWQSQYLNFRVYQANNLCTLKLEGESTKDLAIATTRLENIVAGRRLDDTDGTPMWVPSLTTSSVASRQLKAVEQYHDIAILCQRSTKTLHYFGPASKHQQVRSAVAEKLEELSQLGSFASFEIDDVEFAWALHGGIRLITSKFGNDVISLDLTSTPKKVIVSSSNVIYQQIVTIVREKQTSLVSTKLDISDSTCPICMTEAESPITISCGHTYCSDCFEGLCQYTSSGDSDFAIVCQGALGTCGRTLETTELQNHLSSTDLEAVLETSFKSFVSSRPTEFKYCPTPECGHLYRCGGQTRNLACMNCMEVNCTSCSQRHPRLSCSDYKYLKSGDAEAFDRYKRENGVKDCPKCQTPIEKTYGCNHMTCEGCRTHICWVCLATFAKGHDVYGHMNMKHGGIYDREMML